MTGSGMRRAAGPEILEEGGLPEKLVVRTYVELERIHRFLGDTAALLAALKRDPLPVRRVLDIGCGRGGILALVQRKLSVEGIGVDLRPPRRAATALRIVTADAVRDPLPAADVAYSIHVAHHLSEEDLIALIRNVGRSCRRLVLLDLVRHRLPWLLFRCFVAPCVGAVTAADGELSVRRAFTAAELRAVVGRALDGAGAYTQSVAPFLVRQMVDIRYRPEEPNPPSPRRLSPSSPSSHSTGS
jgi:SAM-dependent methyltransferase